MEVQQKTMEGPSIKKVEQFLHMNGGEGETSYAKNSKSQGKVLSMTKPIIEEAILAFYNTTIFPESIGIADLGCSAGPNTLVAVTEIMNAIDIQCRQLDRSSPEFQVYLNDLPGNDFNTVFKSLTPFHEKLHQEKGESFGPCFFAGVPGSFYGRLFPIKSLHFVHSSYSIHWLSQVPPELREDANVVLNKGKIYISKTSPVGVSVAYLTQFQRDFSVFLKSRSKEMVAGGHMVLTLRGRRVGDPSTDESCILWDFIAQALNDLVFEGLIEEKKVDSFNVPYYDPSPEEMKLEIQKEGSFTLSRLEIGVMDPKELLGSGNSIDKHVLDMLLAKGIRSVSEPILKSQFGEGVMGHLYERLGEHIGSTTKGITNVTLVLSLTRNA
ncbi:hypothetical protein GIB67_015750 [Kingdonia uniflora]|uniref:Uncharacterized protein n=1 Tax=Kingdonia uniflora TaxID=39325 RepID=A0A7J7NV60_9MAGN|nr:hypothetical protein GIB67_015750 [Kingdonia uniflora]